MNISVCIPREKELVFPDKCHFCGCESPGNHFSYKLNLSDWMYKPKDERVIIDIPACQSCGTKFKWKRLFRELLLWIPLICCTLFIVFSTLPDLWKNLFGFLGLGTFIILYTIYCLKRPLPLEIIQTKNETYVQVKSLKLAEAIFRTNDETQTTIPKNEEKESSSLKRVGILMAIALALIGAFMISGIIWINHQTDKKWKLKETRKELKSSQKSLSLVHKDKENHIEIIECLDKHGIPRPVRGDASERDYINLITRMGVDHAKYQLKIDQREGESKTDFIKRLDVYYMKKKVDLEERIKDLEADIKDLETYFNLEPGQLP